MTRRDVPADTNGRTHEPNLRELVAEMDGLRALLDERDRRYDERNTANKEAVKAALASAEKAGDKTEAALKEYKVASNEWRETVKDLVGRVPARPEFDQQSKSLEEQIMQQSKAMGMHVTRLDEKIDAAMKPVMDYIAAARGRGLGMSTSMSTIAWVIAIITSLIAIGSFVFRAAPTAPPQVIMMPAPTVLPTTPPQQTPR